ncbi:hypothetical protein ACFQ1I_23205 [Kitasatospora arboriphila]
MSILDDPCTTARTTGLPGSLTSAADALRPTAFGRAAETDRLRGLDAALAERLA